MKLTVWIAALAALSILPAPAQNNARVINQADTGLARPSGSYIGAGTMSQSARGLSPAGRNANPLLPSVNMGANIRTPGDNMYQPKPQAQQQNPRLPKANMGANIGTAGDNMRSDLRYYVPGQNARNYPRQNPSPRVIYKPGSGGTATYAGQNYGSSDNGARRF